MSITFLPADVVINPGAPLVDTLGRSELEVSAAVLVRALAISGNTWRAVTEAEFASVADWKAAGASEGEVAFSCVGRRLPKCERAFQKGNGPCDYAGGGLFAINPVAVEMPSGDVRRTFAFAAVDPGAAKGGGA